MADGHIKSETQPARQFYRLPSTAADRHLRAMQIDICKSILWFAAAAAAASVSASVVAFAVADCHLAISVCAAGAAK